MKTRRELSVIENILAVFLVILNVTSALVSSENKRLDQNVIQTQLPSNFYSESLPDDLMFMPTMGNGHLGFTVFGDSIYMNGLYSGRHGLSHRARIPNYSNISLIPDVGTFRTSYNLDTKTGIFEIRMENEKLRILHYIFPHRFYTRAIINQIEIYRLQGKGALRINIRHQSGQRTEDIDFSEPTTITRSSGSEDDQQNPNGDNKKTIHLIQGYTREVEDDRYQKSRKRVCCLWNHVPEEITLQKDQRSASYRFVTIVDELCSVAKQEMTDVLNRSTRDLLEQHKEQWLQFWDSFSINVGNNLELAKVIHGSIFYLASSLPSFHTNQPSPPYYGLSPSGLGRGGVDANDYQGHNFWDTEIWMLPPVTQMDPRWTRQLLAYRFHMLDAAKDHAKRTGFKGARFPWESAFTGTEVINPCCTLVAQQQLHITGDIGLALQHYFSITYDLEWLHNEGCPLAENIAEFWANKSEIDEDTGEYDIKYIMGPDEDHTNVTNNVYTNVVASYALKFGEFAASLCNSLNQKIYSKWIHIANKLKVLYDPVLDYHPQYEGYKPTTTIKQADAVLLGYPLLFPMNKTTRENDLRIYEKATRESGPAMTWAMHAISHLDVGNYSKADELFERSYQNYVRSPFQVWSEVTKGEGATNFQTGIGGFLQSLINGYAGVRFFLDRMEVQKPRLLPNTDKFVVSGLKYLGSRFTITATKDSSILHCDILNPSQSLIFVTPRGEIRISQNTTYDILDSKMIIKPESVNFYD